MSLANSWSQHFLSLPSNESGNKNISNFSLALDPEKSTGDRLKLITEEMNYVLLTAGNNGSLQTFHSLKNFGGTMLRKENKVAALVGMGALAMVVKLNTESALRDCGVITPLLEEIKACSSGQDFENLAVPNQENGLVTFNGSACFLPAPFLTTAINAADSNDLKVLIPAAIQAAEAFDREHEEDDDFQDSATTHVEDFCLWGFAVMKGLIEETRFTLEPEDGELNGHLQARQNQCIMSPISSTLDMSVFNQLANSISIQTEEAAEANRLRAREIKRAEERDESKNFIQTNHHHIMSSSVETKPTQPASPPKRQFINRTTVEKEAPKSKSGDCCDCCECLIDCCHLLFCCCFLCE